MVYCYGIELPEDSPPAWKELALDCPDWFTSDVPSGKFKQIELPRVISGRRLGAVLRSPALSDGAALSGAEGSRTNAILERRMAWN